PPGGGDDALHRVGTPGCRCCPCENVPLSSRPTRGRARPPSSYSLLHGPVEGVQSVRRRRCPGSRRGPPLGAPPRPLTAPRPPRPPTHPPWTGRRVQLP